MQADLKHPNKRTLFEFTVVFSEIALIPVED